MNRPETETFGTSNALELEGLRHRKRVFDTGWMALLLMVSLSASLLAYIDQGRLDPVPIGWGIFVYGLVYAFVSQKLAHIEEPQRLSNALFGTQIVGIIALGLLWYRMGGLNNPAMLLAFAIPTLVASVHHSSWQVFSVALLCIVVVSVGAIVDSPELRWSLSRIGVPGLETWIGRFATPDIDRPFADASLSPGQSVTLLASFATGITTLALAVDGFRSVLDRLIEQVGKAETAVEAESQRATEALRSSVLPTVLVYADSVIVADLSTSFEHAFDQHRANVIGRNLFEIVDWSHPDTVEDLLRAGGGELKLIVQRIDDQQSLKQLRIQMIRHENRDCALITIADASDRWLLDNVLAAIPVAALLIGPAGRITHINEQTLFPSATVGSPAASALSVDGLPADWWQPAPLTRDQHRVTVEGTPYIARCEMLRLPGQRQGWTLVTFAEAGGRA